MLGYDRTIPLGNTLEHPSTGQIMDRMARDVEVTGLGHIPRRGPALIVAHHLAANPGFGRVPF